MIYSATYHRCTSWSPVVIPFHCRARPFYLISNPYVIPHSQDDGYWRGVKVRTREEGLFPGNYVAEQHPTSTPTTMVRRSTLVRFGLRCLHRITPHACMRDAVVGDGRGGRHGASSRECSQVFADDSGPRDVCVYKDRQF